MSSVSADTYSLIGSSGFRLKRADDGATIAGGSFGTVPFALARADDAPAIIVVIHTIPGADAALAEAIERATAHGKNSDSSLGFTRAIPENAVPAVREVCSLIRSQSGYAGSITALAVEKVRVDESRHTRASTDVRDRTSLKFNELAIDPARREVWVEGSLIGLTKSEFDLLYVLAQRPGVVFSRRQIVLAYKGADYPVDDRSIDVQMFNLRRKIRSAGAALQTIRGVGYRFTGTARS